MVLFPVDALRFAPKRFKVVKMAGFFAEDMDDDIHIINQDPVIVVTAAKRFFAVGSAELFDVIRDGAHLPAAGTGADHEEIGDG